MVPATCNPCSSLLSCDALARHPGSCPLLLWTELWEHTSVALAALTCIRGVGRATRGICHDDSCTRDKHIKTKKTSAKPSASVAAVAASAAYGTTAAVRRLPEVVSHPQLHRRPRQLLAASPVGVFTSVFWWRPLRPPVQWSCGRVCVVDPSSSPAGFLRVCF